MHIIHGMNDNHSHLELKYRPRWIASPLRDAVRNHPIIVLTGARQVGKSTLLQQEPPFSEWRYISLDDFHTRPAVVEAQDINDNYTLKIDWGR